MTARRASMEKQISLLLVSLDRAFADRGWHGPTLLGSLRGVGPEHAAWRPRPGRHNIWELLVHAAYWKYRVYLRLTHQPPRRFELKGSDWFKRPAEESTRPAKEALDADLRLLEAWHDRLKTAVAALDIGRLQDRPGSSRHSLEELILGAAAHDVYHAGQIQLLKRLREDGFQPSSPAP